MTQLKLEVGKKYNLRLGYNPCIYFGNIKDYGFVDESHPYIFINNNGDLLQLDKYALAEITEHRELIKKSFEGWINYYSCTSVECFPSELGKITNLPCGPKIYKSKQAAQREAFNTAKQMYGRFTFEQLPEPEDK